jgi:hypothetical protein
VQTAFPDDSESTFQSDRWNGSKSIFQSGRRNCANCVLKRLVLNQFFKVVGEIVQTAFSNGSESTFQSVRWNCSCILSLLFTTPVAFYQLSSCVVVYVFALGRQMILSLVFNIIKKTASLWVASFWHISLSLSLYIYIYIYMCVCVCVCVCVYSLDFCGFTSIHM